MVSNTEESVTYDGKTQEALVRNRKRKIKGYFTPVGKLTSYRDKHTDIFDLLAQVSKGAFRLFTELKRHRDEKNNLVYYPTKDRSKTQKETFSRRLRELRKYNIVRIARARMKVQNPVRLYICERQTYMINPDLLRCWEHEDADQLWIQCKP